MQHGAFCVHAVFFAFVLFSWRFYFGIDKIPTSGVDSNGDFGNKRDSLLSAKALH